MGGAVLPMIKSLLTHGKDFVRKRAVMVLQTFILKSPSIVSVVAIDTSSQ